MLGATVGERAAFASLPGGRYRVDGSGGGTWPGGEPAQGRRSGTWLSGASGGAG